MYEILPIPDDRATEKRPIALQFNDIRAWPGQNIAFTLDWNSALRRWIFSAEHDTLGRLYRETPAQIARVYNYRDFFLCGFNDRTGDQRRVTPRNLGDTIQLVAVPGPENPVFDTYGEE